MSLSLGALDFDTAWKQVYATHEGLEAARMEVNRREEERLATRSLNLPQVDLSARAIRLNGPIRIDLDPIRQALEALHPGLPSGALPSFVVNVQDRDFWQGQVSAVWPIYTGGRISAAKQAANALHRQASEQVRGEEYQLATELVRRYFGLKLAEYVLQMRGEVLEGMEIHLNHAQALAREGQIAAAERLHAQVARDEAFRELQQARRSQDILRTALASLLRAEAVEPLATPLCILPDAVEALAFFRESSRQEHPGLAALEAYAEQAQAGVAAERGRFRPEVYLFGFHELNRSDLTLLDPEWSVGVGMRLPVLDRTSRVHRVRAARSAERQVRLKLSQAGRDLAALVEKHYHEMAQAQEQFTTLVSSIELAAENLRLRETAFAEGLGTSLEVVDARLSLSRAKTLRAMNAYNYLLHLAELLEASGLSRNFPEYMRRNPIVVEP